MRKILIEGMNYKYYRQPYTQLYDTPGKTETFKMFSGNP